MNPLSFLFGLFGGGGSQAPAPPPWFQAATQGVSTYSSGINPAALEATVDFGGTPIQYSTINTLTVGGIMGLFTQAVANATGNGLTSVLNWLGLATPAGDVTGGGNDIFGAPSSSDYLDWGTLGE